MTDALRETAGGGDPSAAAAPDRRLRSFDRRLLGRVRSARVALVVDVVAGLAATALLLAQATLVAGVVADAVEGSDRGVPGAILVVLAAVVLGRAGLAHVVEVSGRRAATKAMSMLRLDLVGDRLSGPRRLHGPTTDAELVTAAVQGVDSLETYFGRYLPQVVLALLVPVAVLAWSLHVDPTSALIMLVTLPVVPVFMVLIGKSAGARSRANWHALVALSGHFLDVVRGLPTLRAFNRGREQTRSIAAVTEEYRRTTMGTLRLAFLSGLVLDLAATLSTALVAVTLGVRLVGGSLGLAPALTVLLLVPELYAPIRTVGSLFHASADGLAAAERVLDALPEEGSRRVQGAASVPESRDAPGGSVVLRDATLTYPGRSRPSVEGVDLEIEPGELLVVVGESGSGKTTLLRLILGLTPPDRGTVTVGGRQLDRETAEAWRGSVAWAPERPALVTRSISGNIALAGQGEVEMLAAAPGVRTAARMAGAHEFIEDLPEGYATVVGPGGRDLSAGERRRVGLARAFFRDAPFLVLDEPTAHLDRATAGYVTETLARMKGTRTIVVATHDLELVSLADRLVCMDAGRLPGGSRSAPPVPAPAGGSRT